MGPLAEQIEQIMAQGEYEFYGLRIDEGVLAEVGEVARRSRVWADGDLTDQMLDGTSTLAVDKGGAQSVLDALAIYHGDQISLLGSYYRAWGEDDGEVIMRDAVVLLTTTHS